METDPVHVAYAGFWWRVLAYVLDFVLLGAVFFVTAFAFGLLFMPDTGAGREVVFRVLGIVGPWLYFALMESSAQQATVGKKACSLKVTDLDGERISFARATGRYFAKALSGLLLMIGYLMVAFTRRKQGLHDKLAGTLVVRVAAPTPRLPVESAA